MTSSATGPRQRLINTAALLFNQRSYEAVGVQELCEQADVRRGSFYYYFPSKQDLALAVIESDWHRLREEVFEPAFARSTPPLQRWHDWVDKAAEWYGERASLIDGMGGCPIGNLGQELSTVSPAVRAAVADVFDEVAGYFERALVDGIAAGHITHDDPSAGATQVLAFLQGMLLLAQTADDPNVIRELGLDGIRHSGARTTER